MESKFLGSDIKKLGFGLMRLPMQGETVDIEQLKKMVDLYMSKGFTYFDTAYVYTNGKSEVAAKEALVDRYPRESFQLATKLPVFLVKNADDMPRLFNESLTRAGVEYFDFYLLHALGKDSANKCDELGAWDFIKQQKENGRIRHIGFSFHDTAEVLDDILTKHPETEFVQLQINYADWEDEGVQARLCYEVARKHNVPVIIMEPVKGGSLVNMHESVCEVFRNANPDVSIPSWAVRYCASLDGIVTVLSGMSNLEQVADNTGYMENFQPLSSDERKVIAAAVEALKKIPQISCTDCKYCVDECPQKINIPGILSVYNEYKVYSSESSLGWGYGAATRNGGKASDCIACGVCEGHCPQHITIVEHLKDFSAIADR